MKRSMGTISLLILLTIQQCWCVKLDLRHTRVSARVGEEVRLVCTADTEVRTCSFDSPKGRNLGVINGAKYEEGRIEAAMERAEECGIRITEVRDEDNGIWTCNVGGFKRDSDQFVSASADSEVVVALAPSELQIRVDGEPNLSSNIDLRLNNGSQEEASKIACVALQTRPEPQFKWFLNEELLRADTNVSIENESEDEDKADYVATLDFYAQQKHHGKRLRCVVDQEGYTEAQKETEMNVVERVLNLYFKPESKPVSQRFYGLKEGAQATITITFNANPQPTDGFWHLDGVDSPLAFGSQSVDQRFESTFIEEGNMSGEYKVSLTIKKLTSDMAGKSNKMSVTNSEGTTDYGFVLELGEKPETAPLGSGPVVGIVLIVIIVVVLALIALFARSKKMLCFAEKGEDSRGVDKTSAAAFDNAEKGGEPLNPQEAETVARESNKEESGNKEENVKKEEQEEKKSNGAHTPV